MTFQTGDTDITANDQEQYFAPDEGTGTDAITVGARWYRSSIRR